VSHFSEEDRCNLFWFELYDIPALACVLVIPEYVIVENRGQYTRCTSEEELLILVLRLRVPNRLDEVSHRMGRSAKVMVKVLLQMVGHMLTNIIGVWTTYCGRAASGIRAKMGMQAHQDKGMVCCFVDGTLRPHGTPLDDVAKAATYSGCRRNHCHLWGPVVERRHDSYLMRRSLNARL
ncbi:unnamed protein product, partial [Discosporangium mesarthrocarpum]